MPPNIVDADSSADIAVQESEDAILMCRATGHPPPRVTWKREDGDSMLMRKGGSRELIKGIVFFTNLINNSDKPNDHNSKLLRPLPKPFS